MLRLMVFFMLLLSLPAFADKYQIENRLISDYGEIQTLRTLDKDGYSGPPSLIRLHGRIIYAAPIDEPYISLLGIYHVRGGQALLISQNCGGSGCRISPLFFVLLNRKLKTQVVSSADFNVETGQLKVYEQAGKVIVDLGYYRQKKKVAILDDGHLNIELQDDANNTLADELCNKLYNSVDECANEFSAGRRCWDYADTDFSAGGFIGSNVANWRVREASHHPGFNRAGFIAACDSICRTGAKDDYEVFKAQACVRNR